MSSASVTLGGAERLSGTLGTAGQDVADLEQVNRSEARTTLVAADVPVRTGYLESRGYVDADAQGFTLLNDADYAYRAAGPYARSLEARTSEITDRLTNHVETALASVQGA